MRKLEEEMRSIPPSAAPDIPAANRPIVPSAAPAANRPIVPSAVAAANRPIVPSAVPAANRPIVPSAAPANRPIVPSVSSAASPPLLAQTERSIGQAFIKSERGIAVLTESPILPDHMQRWFIAPPVGHPCLVLFGLMGVF